MSGGQGRAGAHIAPPPEPADVGIVAALPIEVAPLIARLKDVRKYSSERHTVVEGMAGTKVVALIVSGPGREAARRGAELLLAGHRPRWVLSAGFAGALDPALRRNEVLFPSEVLDAQGLRISVGGSVRAEGEGPAIRDARLVTVEQVVLTAAQKADLRAKTGADAVDMETVWVAKLCAERQIRFLSIRVVSDEAGVDMPPEILSIMGPTGGYRVGAALGAIWKRPSSLKELLRLRDHANEAARKLGEVVSWAIARLP